MIASLIAIAALAGTGLATPSQGEAAALPDRVSLDMALDAVEREDFARALQIAEIIAATGQPDAQFLAGNLYANGMGAAQNMRTALGYLVAAAGQGQANAQFTLGELAYLGKGVALDWTRAAEWFNLAAAQGHGPALVRLGYMYAEGQSVPQDLERAASLFRAAAEQGSTAAQYHMGLFYLEGEGVPQDYRQAAEWFEMAARNGDADSMYNLGLLLESGRLGGVQMQEAIGWLSKAAQAGILPAQVSMGLLYYNGRGVPQSDSAAMEWFKEAGEGGSAEGMFLYAVGLAEGLDGPVDYRRAKSFAQRAVDMSVGDPPEVLAERQALLAQLEELTTRPAARQVERRRPPQVAPAANGQFYVPAAPNSGGAGFFPPVARSGAPTPSASAGDVAQEGAPGAVTDPNAKKKKSGLRL